MKTWEDVLSMWQWFVVAFAHVPTLTMNLIQQGNNTVTLIKNVCGPRDEETQKTFLTENAKRILVEFNTILVGEEEFFEGYLMP